MLFSLFFACVVSVAHSFTKLQSGRAYYCFVAFRELSRFVYCLLQNVKRIGDLPVIEKWEAYKLPKQTTTASTRLRRSIFWKGPTCYHPSKKNSSFLRKQYRRDCRSFREDFVSTIVYTIATRSLVGQSESCFCLEITIGGDNYSAFHLFDQLLDGLLFLG